MSIVVKISVYVLVLGLIVYLVTMIFMKVKENLLPYDPKVDELKRKLALVHPKSKQLQFYTDKKSYTINKKKMHLCVKDENNTYYDDNMLIYVALHELAHVLCDEIGHTPKYWAIFDDVLEKAAKTIDPITNKPVYNPDGVINKNYCDSKYHNS
tara:strand:- start:137 stop:598 length:462 start_codon:yes stop_codon:yes gene_type:complete